jgi:hypothetical protein
MPKIAVYNFLTFFIYSFDAINEPPHLHVVTEKGRRSKSAKIWLTSREVAERGSLTDKEINLALELINKYNSSLIEAFNKVSRGEKIKTIKMN